MNKLIDHYNKVALNWISYRKKRAYYWNSITRYCNYFIPADHKVLEIGCATGELLAGLEAKDKTGIDFSSQMISRAKEQFPEIRFEEMPAEAITLNDSYDTIILSNLLGVLPDIERVLEQLHSITTPQSRLIITDHNPLWQPLIRLAEWLKIKRRTPIQNWLSRNDIKNLLYLSDFELYRINKNMLIPYNIPVISPLLNRFLSRLPLINHLCLNRFLFARPIPQADEQQNAPSVSVVIPARNEAGNIEDAITRMPQMGKHTEIIFVEGHSSDQTWNTIQQMAIKYASTHDIKAIQQTGKGKGDAVRAGFQIAKGELLMILDADLTVPPEDLPHFYNALSRRKGEFINGVRLVYAKEKRAMRPLNTIGNYFFSLLFSWLLEQPVKDTLCGTKVIFKSDYERLVKNRPFFGEFDPFGDFDLLFGAHKLNLKIVDLPIRYRERKYGSTNINRFSHGSILLRMAAFAAVKIKFW